jgi:hypothetical protein
MLEDDMVQTVINLATFAWLLGWAICGLRDILSSGRNSVSFVLVTHFVFCGLPLLLDETVGKPDYLLWRGFNIAAADPLTNLVYCLYAGACPLVFWGFGRAATARRGTNPRSNTAAAMSRMGWQGKSLLHLILLAPFIALYFAPNPSAYREYAAVMRGVLTPDELAYHPILSACTMSSAIAGAGLLFSQRALRLTCIYVLPIAFLVAWLDGKRAVVLIVCVMFAIALWSRGVLTKRMAIVWGLLLMGAFTGFSVLYQSEVRRFGEVEWSKRYHNLRLDYGRDHVMRLTLYAQLHPDTPPILEYRGQSLLFNVAMLVPRTVWPNKPWPYAVYATAATFRVPVRYMGWGITTSWLEEAIANLGWSGMLAGPLLIAFICRSGDSRADTIVWLLTILVSSMLLAVQAPAFTPLVLIWVVSMVAARRLPEARQPQATLVGHFPQALRGGAAHP